MTWTPLILLLCLVAASSALIYCPKLFACEKPIRDEGVFADTESLIFKIDDKKVLDSICGKVPALKTCVSSQLDGCRSKAGKIDTQHFRDIMEYICTPEGTAVALATGKTSCTLDVDLNDWFLLYVLFDCSDSFDLDILDAEFEKGGPLTLAESCPLKAKLDTCVKSEMNTKCGTEMAAMIEKMWELWSHYEYPQDKTCGQAQTRKRRSVNVKRSIRKGSRWSEISN